MAESLVDAYVRLMMATGLMDRVADPVNPKRMATDAKAAAASAVDPFGLTSGAIGQYSPDAAKALTDIQDESAVGSAAGAIAGGGGAAALASRVAKPVAAGLAGLIGMTGSAKPAGGRDPEFEELRRSLIGETPEVKRLRQQVDDAAAAVRSSTALEGKAAGSKQMQARGSATASAREALAQAEERLAAEVAKGEQEATRRADAIMMGRAEGKKARKEVLDSQPKPFFQQYEAARADLPFLPSGSVLPIAGGAAMVGATKALPTMSAWLGRGTASRALASGDDALAQALVDQHAPTRSFMQSVGHHAKPAAIGGAVGMGAGAAPLGLDAYQLPLMNPEKEAGNRFVEQLLDIDPRKAEERKRVDQMPPENPAKVKAQDWQEYVKAMGFGALEGATGGKIAGLLADAATPGFKNVKAALAARAPASPPPGGGKNGPNGPPPNVPRSYDPYRDEVRARYRTHVADNDLPPDPSDFNKAATLSYGSSNPPIPNIVRRTEATNKALEDFVAKHGRMPKTTADYTEIFKKTKTLGLVGGVPLAGLLMSPEED